ncbi:MAG: alkaline phosphatase family protein, partial [Elusimicrobiota bacterium]
ALEAVRSLSLGADEHADLLAVGISGVDVVGHRHGPDHPSMDAQLEGLDEGLGRFLSELDRLVGRGRYALVLASDHGVLPVPESPPGRALGARRILFRDLLAQAERAWEARLPRPGGQDGRAARRGGWIEAGFPPNIHLDRSSAARSGLGRDALLREAAAALAGLDSVAEVFTSDRLEGFATDSSSYSAVFQRAYCPGRSGDLMVLLKPFVFIADGPQGTGHGLPYDYDARVPLLFAGPGISPGRRDLPASLEDIAPTAARLIEVPFPPARGARVLEEIFQPPTGRH